MSTTRGVTKPCDTEVNLTELGNALAAQDERIKARYLNKVSLNWQDAITGNTPLHLAARALDVGYVIELLRLGADPNCLNKVKDTPLALALEAGKSAADTQIADVLLKNPAKPADPTLYRYEHASPLGLAILNDDGCMVDKLLPSYRDKLAEKTTWYQYWLFLAVFAGEIRKSALLSLQKGGAKLNDRREGFTLFDSVALNCRINAELNQFKSQYLTDTLDRYEFLLTQGVDIGDTDLKTVLKNLDKIYQNTKECKPQQERYEAIRNWVINRIEQPIITIRS